MEAGLEPYPRVEDGIGRLVPDAAKGLRSGPVAETVAEVPEEVLDGVLKKVRRTDEVEYKAVPLALKGAAMAWLAKVRMIVATAAFIMQDEVGKKLIEMNEKFEILENIEAQKHRVLTMVDDG